MSIVYWEIGNILTLFCTLCIKRHWTLDFYQDRFPTDSVPAALSHLLQCSLALLKIQVSICPISTCGLLAANRAKTLFDNNVSTLPIKYYSNCFPIYIWSQGVAALATGPVLMSPVPGVSTVSSVWPGHCPATTGLVSTSQSSHHLSSVARMLTDLCSPRHHSVNLYSSLYLH